MIATGANFHFIRIAPAIALILLAGNALWGCSGGGGGSSSANSSAPVSPCAPGSAALASGTAQVTWDPLNAANLAGYRVYYGTAPSSYLQLPGQGINAGNFTTLTVSGLNRGSRYYFAVTAYDAADVESPYSNEVCKDIL